MRKERIELVDDITGESLGDGGETVEFALDGKTYEIDLSDKRAEDLRGELGAYIAHARRIDKTSARQSSSSGRKPASVDREQSKAARSWLKSHGWEIADRGRIPSDAWAAYQSAA